MTAINPSELLLSLAAAMADAAGLTLGQDLFVHQLPASASTASGCAALRIYGGPVEGELRPVPVVSVQCMVWAQDAGAGLLLARRLYDALHDPANGGRPRTHWSIAGKTLDDQTGQVVDDPSTAWDIRLIVLHAGPPGIVGRDGEGRWEIPFNFDVRFSAD